MSKKNIVRAESTENYSKIEQLAENISDYYRPRKQQISIRIDSDILAWFKQQPGKYQQLINKACRIYMRMYQDKELSNNETAGILSGKKETRSE